MGMISISLESMTCGPAADLIDYVHVVCINSVYHVSRDFFVHLSFMQKNRKKKH